MTVWESGAVYIYLSGCSHACHGCHNPQSWSPENGKELTDDLLERIVEKINTNPILDGITMSGGDPFFNPEKTEALLKVLKERTNQNIWCYTGYTIEEICQRKELSSLLQYNDVLVDGPFIKGKYQPG